jgi:ABC-type Fe3+/spermidine/putrescine transport system ATPase subunit
MATTIEKIAVSVRGVSKTFGPATVLRDINFDVLEGEILVLLGASGSGKTTILRVISGLEMPDSGTVLFHGKEVTDLPARQRGTGVIFQSYALFPKMDVEKNIAYGLRLRRKSRAEIKGPRRRTDRACPPDRASAQITLETFRRPATAGSDRAGIGVRAGSAFVR